METKNLIGVFMTITVGVILIGSLLVGVVNGYADEELTYTNDGVSFVAIDDQEHTMIITNNEGTPEITVDGIEVEQPAYAFSNQSTVIYGEDGLLRVWKVNDLTRLRVQASERIAVNLNDGESATITFDATNITMGNKTVAIKPIAYLGNGDYSQLVKPVVKSDSNIILAGLTEGVGGVNSQYVVLCGEGTIDNLTVKCVDFTLTDTSITVTDVSADVQTTDLGNGLYRIDDIVITTTFSDSSTFDAHYSYFLGPAEFQYNNPNYLGSASAAMLGAVIVVCIVAIMMIAVRAVNRD